MIIRVISGRQVTQNEVIPNHNKCLIHFLDLDNLYLIKEYLKAAWKSGSVGGSQLYFVNVGSAYQMAYLNSSEMFDFQKLLIATSAGVRIPYICLNQNHFI